MGKNRSLGIYPEIDFSYLGVPTKQPDTRGDGQLPGKAARRIGRSEPKGKRAIGARAETRNAGYNFDFNIPKDL